MREQRRVAHDGASLRPPLFAAVFLRVVLQASLAFEAAVFEDLCSAGTRFNVKRISTGLTKTVGSVTVASYWMVSGSTSLNRSSDVFVLVDEVAAMSSQVRPLKLLTSTTSVSPSQRPRESPSHAQ